MSSIRSLGLHEPSALPYLVAESIICADPSPTLYSWKVFRTHDTHSKSLVEEEILTTEHCVVWSRNGAIQRALNLDVEGESILHAFVTHFDDGAKHGESEQQYHSQVKSTERGLIVVLKTQAHIFLLSGDSYVLPLSFEVEAAFPLPFGFILQRKLDDIESDGHSEPIQHDLSTINETLTSVGGTSSRPSLVLPIKQHAIPKPIHSNANGMPRTFSFTEVMSELGLVVWSTSRKGEPLEICNALPRSEKLVFISGCDDIDLGDLMHQDVCMAVTLNEADSSFTLWHVTGGPVAEPHSEESKRDDNSKSRTSLRKSSNLYGRDTGNLRESLAGSRPPLSESGLFSSLEEKKSFPVNDLASQLGPEFGEVGVQTRSARRVGSMLARTDLGSAMDRNTFNDLAMGHPGRQTFNRAGRRGESIGSFSDRQSLGFRRRSSFPANASMFSTGTSFLDISARGLIEEIDPLRQSTRLEDDTVDATESNLPRKIRFLKVKTFPKRKIAPNPSTDLDVKVFLLTGSSPRIWHGQRTRDVYLYLMDKSTEEMTLIKVLIKVHSLEITQKRAVSKYSIELKAAEVRKLSGFKDVCTIVDGSIQRLAILTQSRSQTMSLQLEAPWSPPFQVDLPASYAINDPFMSSQWSSPRKDRDIGMRRVLPAAEVQIQALRDSGLQAQIYAVDQNSRQHALGLHLAPRDAVVRQILQMCDMILGQDQQESLLVTFWEVSRWLGSRELPVMCEWTALIVVLFSLAVPFIGVQVPKSTPSRRRKAALLRSSSGSAVELADYDDMHDESDIPMKVACRGPAWKWLVRKAASNTIPSPSPKHSRTASTDSMTSFYDGKVERKNSFLIRCIALAKEYTQTPVGEAALGPEGYLPTSINKDREQRCNALPSIVLGLHLLYEESKLDTASSPNLRGSKSSLVVVLGQLGRWLRWKDWTADSNTYYEHESSHVMGCSYDESSIDGLRIPTQPFPPPSIYEYLENWVNGSSSATFLTLARISGSAEPSSSNDPLWQQMATLTPRTMTVLSFVNQASGSLAPEAVVDTLLKAGISEHTLATLPDGVAAAFFQALASKCYRMDKFTGRDDQAVVSNHPVPNFSHNAHKQQTVVSHEALRDYHSICSSTLEAETPQRWDASSEADRQAITKLIFKEDRRFQEASKLVNQTKPPVVECTPEPDWTEVVLLEAQTELAQHVTRRTLSVAAGRGMMHFNARVPLLTERVPIPAFSLQCIMKPRNADEGTQAMTFSADKASFTEEKVSWAFFHNGASMGLMISNDARGIDTSWILYNKPPELTNRHAGFLLALGLNGHLRTLAKWVAFKYLTPKHTMTSVGLLLGLSASFLGTMDTLITRLLSVHVTRLLPPGAAELNLSPLTQTTGIMGIGLLYYNSQHRRISEVMLSEIENNDSEEGIAPENVLRDEGYRLAAGFSLGLINLGKGRRLNTLHDMGVVERLLTIAVGTKNVDMVHILGSRHCWSRDGASIHLPKDE